MLLRALLNVACQRSSLCVHNTRACVYDVTWHALSSEQTHKHTRAHTDKETGGERKREREGGRENNDELGVCLSNITFVPRPGELNNRGNVSTNTTLRFYKSKIFIFDSSP